MRMLLCISGMPHAETTARFGGLIARVTQSSVTLLHVARRKEDRMAGERALARAREMMSDLPVDTLVSEGDPTEEIAAKTREGGYDLVVIGTPKVFGIEQRLLGSVTLQVVRRVPVSVLVVRRAPPALQRVLICTSGWGVAEPVVETGAWLAGVAGAGATLLYVANPVPSMYTGLNEMEERLPELLQADTPIARHLRHGAEILARHQVTAELELRHGLPADEILYEAHHGAYDLIVIGASRTEGRLKSWLLGNVTREVVEYALCPVLVVRQALSQGPGSLVHRK